jgi:glycine/D-amino acid oxidase-like deaminating enzyme
MAVDVDALVIGGGFFGCEIALELRRLGLRQVVLCEQQAALMRRASYVNQARVHNGYHYPRSMITAERSRRNFERFISDYRFAIHFGMEKVYAIAATSRVTGSQFDSFCRRLHAPCREAPASVRRLFDDSLIEHVFMTREFAFDAHALRLAMCQRLEAAGVDVRLSTTAQIVAANAASVLVDTPTDVIRAARVVNCTYAAADAVGVALRTALKRELTEMLLIAPPRELTNIGVTVMDGPFFSTMPFPAARLHSLSHVRYTPHEAWTAESACHTRPVRSHAESMLRDATRYLPCLSRAVPIRSMFETKTVLPRNEGDDGRPILAEVSSASGRILTIVGSKIDNIYDALDALRAHDWEQ